MDDPMLQFFAYEHLPGPRRSAGRSGRTRPEGWSRRSPEPRRTVGLRKLLEAKDCAVRAPGSFKP